MRSIAVVLCVLALHSATAQRNQNQNQNRNNRKRIRRRSLQEYKDESDPIYPDNCVQNGTELLQNLREYFIKGRSDSVSAMNFGYPIQSWCVGPEVEDKLRKSESILRSHVSTAVQATTKDSFDAFDDDDANKLMDDWIAMASEQDCLELCGVMDGYFGDSFGEEATAWETQEEEEEEEEEEDEAVGEGEIIWSEEYEAMEESINSNEKDFEMDEEIISHIEEETTTSNVNATATATATTTAPTAVIPIAIDEEDELEEEQILVEENFGGDANMVYYENIQEEQYQQEQTAPADSASKENSENNENYYSIENDQETEWEKEEQQYQQEETAPMENASNASNESNESNENYYSIQNSQEWEEQEEEDRARPITIEDFDITSNENTDGSYPLSTEEEWEEWEEESVPVDQPIAVSRNKTTSAMLIRLIPLKLCALLAFMCLVLGLRQMILNSDRDHCCGKIGALLGFRSGGQVAYQGIDPSDVEASQKSVEFELLQLAASGDDAFQDEDLDNVDIGTDVFGDMSFSNSSDE